MAVNREQPSWRAWLRNLILPYNDLGIDGGPGRVVAIPDDVDITLSYGVTQNPLNSRLMQGLSNGQLIVSPPQPGTNNYFATDLQSVGASSSVTQTWAFDPSLIIVSSQTAILNYKFVMINGGASCRIFLPSNTTFALSIPASAVIIGNATGSAGSYAVTAFGK